MYYLLHRVHLLAGRVIGCLSVCLCYCACLHSACFYSYTTMSVCRVCAVERSRLISYDGQTGRVVACCVRKNSSLTTALKYIRH